MNQKVLDELLAVPDHREWIVFEGLGDGQVLKEYLQNPLSQKKKLLVLDQEIKNLGERGIDEERISFFHGDNVEKFSIFLMKLAKGPIQIAQLQNGTFIRNLEVFVQHQEAYEKLEYVLREGLKLSTSCLGHKEDGLFGLKFVLQNSNWISKTPGVNLLKDLFKGLPAIIASTGPSLKKSIEDISKAKDKAIIICPDASLKILLAAGIVPHFVCSLEREMASKPFFENLSSEDLGHSQLVSFPLVPSSVIQEFKGPHWVAYRTYRSHGFFESQAPRGYLSAGHSVSHMCASLADHLGCSEILLVGQDLAFDPETLASHSENVAYSTWSDANSEAQLRERLKEEGDDLYWAVGNDREKIPTRGYYIVFAREFSELAKRLKAPILNATKGGMKMDGIERADLTARLQAWKAHGINFAAEINAIRASFQASGSINYAELTGALKNIAGLLDQQHSMLKKMIETAGRDIIMTSLIVRQGREFWETLKLDHVAEGFGFEILGYRSAHAESEWIESFEEADSIRRLEQRAEIILSFFSDLSLCLKDALNLIETEVPNVKT